MDRAPGTSAANTRISNPDGSFRVSTGSLSCAGPRVSVISSAETTRIDAMIVRIRRPAMAWVRRAGRASAPARRRAGAWAGRGLGLLRLELLHERLVGLGLQDLVDLGPVIGHEADALDDDVVHEPAPVLLVQPVVDGDLGAPLGDDPGLHGRVVAVDAVADVAHLLALVELDLADVRAIEQLGEQPDELLPLLWGTGIPVRS